MELHIQDEKGDVGILVAGWTGVKKGVKGIPGTRRSRGVPGQPGNPGYCTFLYYCLTTGNKNKFDLPPSVMGDTMFPTNSFKVTI